MKPTATVLARRGSVAQRLLDITELCKARLTSLVLVTVACGYLAAAWSNGLVPSATVFLGVLAGIFLCAAGGATLNQYLERDVDARMERTKDRPLPAGRLAPEVALRFGLASVVAGVLVLELFVHRTAALLGLLSAVNYVAIYTPLKRVTTFNTLVGAVTGALPPLIGWSAATGGLERGGWALFGILFVWQLPHFLAIAWLYREDYARGGMCMLGVADPNGRITMRQILVFSVALLPMSLMPAAVGTAGAIYFWGALVLGGGILYLSARLARSRTRVEARRLFLGSLVYLPLLLGVLLVDCALGGW